MVGVIFEILTRYAPQNDSVGAPQAIGVKGIISLRIFKAEP